MAVSVVWHGHATLSFELGESRVLVDPFFADNPVARTDPSQIAADYILLTHGHGDHVGDALEIAHRTGALVISNFEVCNWIASQGYENVHAQHIGGGFDHPFGRVKLTIAFHGSGLPDGAYGGMPAGFLLTAEGKNIYVAGDTALYSDMELIGEAGLDLAILPIGDNFTMGPDDALRAVEFLRPRLVVPYHFNTWPPITQDANVWADRVRAATGTEVVVLDVDQVFDF